jgi:hypothetical protein
MHSHDRVLRAQAELDELVDRYEGLKNELEKMQGRIRTLKSYIAAYEEDQELTRGGDPPGTINV